jgi:positive regulator of sigma E activity
MNEFGTVKSVENGIARIGIKRSDACEHCGACITTGPDTMELEAQDTLGVKTGDEVRLDFDDNIFIKVAVIAYGIPALAFITTLLVCLIAIKLNEWQSALAAVVSTTVAYYFISKSNFAKQGSAELRPAIAEILQPGSIRNANHCE